MILSPLIFFYLKNCSGPVMNVYLWDDAAEKFRLKFDACAATPTVLLVTTVNPKRLGGNKNSPPHSHLSNINLTPTASV